MASHPPARASEQESSPSGGHTEEKDAQIAFMMIIWENVVMERTSVPIAELLTARAVARDYDSKDYRGSKGSSYLGNAAFR